MKHRYILHSIGVVLLCLNAACSQVAINEQVTQSPYAGLTFKYVWGEDVPDDRKEMILIMNRIQYTQHYIETLGADGLPVAEVPATAWAWGTRTDDAGAGDTSGEGKEQEEGTADEEEDGQTSEDPEEAETAGEKEDGLFVDGVYQVKAGEYIFCTLSALQDGMEIPGLTDFEASTAVSYNELKFSLPDRDIKTLKELKQDDGTYLQWVDLNPGYPYVENLLPVYYEVKKNVTINSGTTLELSFSPQRLTQHFVIPFQLTVEEGVTITRAIAEISGVVKECNLSNGTFSLDADGKNTGRIVFLPQLVSNDENVWKYEGSFDVFGLVPGISDAYSVGPGILQLVIYAEAEGKTKIFRTSKNLYKELSEVSLVNYVEELDKYQADLHEVRLQTNFKFSITREQVTADTEDGVLNWDENEIEGEL